MHSSSTVSLWQYESTVNYIFDMRHCVSGINCLIYFVSLSQISLLHFYPFTHLVHRLHYRHNTLTFTPSLFHSRLFICSINPQQHKTTHIPPIGPIWRTLSLFLKLFMLISFCFCLLVLLVLSSWCRAAGLSWLLFYFLSIC